MSAGIRFGVFLGLLFGIVMVALDPPTAGFVVFGAVALHGARSAWILHSRTPFRNLVGALVIGVVVSAVIAVLSFSEPDGVFAVLHTSPWLFGLLLLAPIALMAESRLHPDAWKAWRDRVERSSLVDLLTGRSVPRLLG
jgi:hypothetical protein